MLIDAKSLPLVGKYEYGKRWKKKTDIRLTGMTRRRCSKIKGGGSRKLSLLRKSLKGDSGHYYYLSRKSDGDKINNLIFEKIYDEAQERCDEQFGIESKKTKKKTKSKPKTNNSLNIKMKRVDLIKNFLNDASIKPNYYLKRVKGKGIGVFAAENITSNKFITVYGTPAEASLKDSSKSIKQGDLGNSESHIKSAWGGNMYFDGKDISIRLRNLMVGKYINELRYENLTNDDDRKLFKKAGSMVNSARDPSKNMTVKSNSHLTNAKYEQIIGKLAGLDDINTSYFYVRAKKDIAKDREILENYEYKVSSPALKLKEKAIQGNRLKREKKISGTENGDDELEEGMSDEEMDVYDSSIIIPPESVAVIDGDEGLPVILAESYKVHGLDILVMDSMNNITFDKEAINSSLRFAASDSDYKQYVKSTTNVLQVDNIYYPFENRLQKDGYKCGGWVITFVNTFLKFIEDKPESGVKDFPGWFSENCNPEQLKKVADTNWRMMAKFDNKKLGNMESYLIGAGDAHKTKLKKGDKIWLKSNQLAYGIQSIKYKNESGKIVLKGSDKYCIVPDNFPLGMYNDEWATSKIIKHIIKFNEIQKRFYIHVSSNGTARGNGTHWFAFVIELKNPRDGDIVPIVDITPLDKHLEDMKKLGSWGGDVEIIAASSYFNVPIVNVCKNRSTGDYFTDHSFGNAILGESVGDILNNGVSTPGGKSDYSYDDYWFLMFVNIGGGVNGTGCDVENKNHFIIFEQTPDEKRINKDNLNTRANGFEKIKLYGKPKKISGDGNCLFRALSYLKYSNEDSHENIRRELVKYMGDNRKTFSTNLMEISMGSKDSYDLSDD